MDNRILTRNPDKSKKGVRINRSKYDLAKAVILDTLRSGGEMTFDDLLRAASMKLAGRLDGSPSWYVTTVKLDMEARGELERVGKSPQRLRLTAR